MIQTDFTVRLDQVARSPQVVLHLEKGETIQKEEARSTGRLLSTEAPRLVPAKGGDKDYLNQLLELMTELLYALIQINTDQSELSKAQNDVSNGIVKLEQEQQKKAEKDYHKVVKAVEKAKHQSFLGKLLGGIAGGLMIVLGAITGNPAFVLMGAFTMAMSTSPAQDKLNEAIAKFSPGVRAAILLGIAAGAAITISAGAGTITAMLTETASETAGEAAAVEAGSAAADAGAGSGASATNQPSFASRVLEAGFTGGKVTGGNFLSNFTQAMLSFNPMIPALEGILKDAGVSKNKREMIAEITGMIIAVGAALAGGFSSDASLLNKPLTETGKKLVSKIPNYAVKFVQGMEIGTRLASGYFQLQTGFAMKDQAHLVKEMGKTKGAMTVYETLLTLLQKEVTGSQESYKQAAQALNLDFSGYVEPFAHIAEIQG